MVMPPVDISSPVRGVCDKYILFLVHSLRFLFVFEESPKQVKSFT